MFQSNKSCRMAVVLAFALALCVTIFFYDPAHIFGPPHRDGHWHQYPRPTLQGHVTDYVTEYFEQPAATFAPVLAELNPSVKAAIELRWGQSRPGGEAGIESLQRLIGVLASYPEIVKNYLINIDIGANVGQTSARLMMEIVRKRSDFMLFAYEPMDSPMKPYPTIVNRSIAENWSKSLFTVFACAVGLSPGTVPFYFSIKGQDDLAVSEQSSMDAAAVGLHLGIINSTNITIINMDQFMYQSIPSSILRHGNDSMVADTNGARNYQKHDIYFYKIDTEGYDMDVLTGSDKILRNKRAKFIEFEYNGKWFTLNRNKTLQMVTQELYSRYQYECYFVSEKHLHPLFDKWWDERYEIRFWSNVFCGLMGDVHLRWIVRRFDKQDFSDLGPLDYIELGIN